MKKRNYDPAFKAEVVRLSYGRENLRELADELDMPVQRIYKWRRAAKDVLMPKSKPIVTEESSSEVKLLRKALREKELELDVLAGEKLFRHVANDYTAGNAMFNEEAIRQF